MPTSPPRRVLLGRRSESEVLDGLLEAVLGFVARRLGNESVGLVFAVRELSEELAGLG